MKKRVAWIMVVGIALAVLFAGCGQAAVKAVSGTWYGDKPDTLILRETGEYSSNWLGNGKFTVEGNTIRLLGTGLDEGSQKELTIGEAGGRKVLISAEQGVTFFTDADAATEAIRKREEAIRTEEAAKIAKELDAFKAELIGTWEWVGYSGDVTFKADGTVSGTVSGMKPGTYKVIDMKTIEITEEERKYTERISISKADDTVKLMFGTLSLVKKQ